MLLKSYYIYFIYIIFITKIYNKQCNVLRHNESCAHYILDSTSYWPYQCACVHDVFVEVCMREASRPPTAGACAGFGRFSYH